MRGNGGRGGTQSRAENGAQHAGLTEGTGLRATSSIFHAVKRGSGVPRAPCESMVCRYDGATVITHIGSLTHCLGPIFQAALLPHLCLHTFRLWIFALDMSYLDICSFLSVWRYSQMRVIFKSMRFDQSNDVFNP